MKHVQLMILPVLALALGCGSKKNPVGSDLSTLREEGRETTVIGPEKPREVAPETRVVIKYVEVPHEESTIDDKFIVITPDPQMSFSEGQDGKFNIRVRVLFAGAQAQLTAQGLPDGAKLTASATEKGLYVLTWTPAIYTVAANENMKTIPVKITAHLTSANPADAAKINGIVRDKDLSLFVFKNSTAPSNVKIDGLGTEVTEGTITTFTVTASVPGVDGQSSQKPTLVIWYDQVSTAPANNFLEMNGAYYIVGANKNAVYLPDSKLWQFTQAFDTKNIAVQPQLAKDGSILTSADGTHVRLSFKVFNGGLSSPEVLSQVKINYSRNLSAPRFDVSGLGKTSLQVSRGQTISLKFNASSVDTKAVVTVTSQPSTLPGAPTVACQVSAQGANKQDCILTWAIPCDATLDKLAGTVDMTATSAREGRDSQSVNYSLQVTAAKTQNDKLCQSGAKPPEVKPKSEVKPAAPKSSANPGAKK